MMKIDSSQFLFSGYFALKIAHKLILDLRKVQTVNFVFDVYFNAKKIEIPLWEQ